jgi:hypothetical protein
MIFGDPSTPHRYSINSLSLQGKGWDDDCTTGLAPAIFLHFLHLWRSDAGGRAPYVGALGDA